MSTQTAGSPATPSEATSTGLIPEEAPNETLSKLSFWAMHVFMLAYCGVLGAAFAVQFLEGEFPCPLCMVQRYAMILASLGGMWIVVQARRGELNRGRYAQGLGMAGLAALLGALESVRQVLLHIMPGDPGYGSAVLGYHLYTWALITFYVVLVFVALCLVLMQRAVPAAPARGSGGWKVSTVLLWVFMILVALNVIAIIFLEGFAFVLPDDPTSYNLLDQLGITN